ncbi:MAG: 3-hydroxylacyl-ACP dehydratase [Azonexus sp.]|jgi:predicted hotdog family 3-hydroxylacyl-ACP dehydratase|nr:3-hydroxylacyl-ACP dehydratase [Azonexus sp.]
MLDRVAIAARIPHQGSMCLLDAVLAWDSGQIHCRASSHRQPDNPLRAAARLGAACGIEYAAQAMAVHGALLAPAGAPPRPGYLASVRSVQLAVDRLDDLPQDLDIVAERLSGDEHNILYHFRVEHAGDLLLSGRAAVMLVAQPESSPA